MSRIGYAATAIKSICARSSGRRPIELPRPENFHRTGLLPIVHTPGLNARDPDDAGIAYVCLS